jgi:hypothetical protein
MAGPLSNTKHERFVQALIKGETLAAAYVAAGYRPNEKNAARLKKNEGVAARLVELQSKVAEKVTTTAADIARQLDEDREFARTSGQAAAAVSATMGKAKVLGLISDRHEHTGKNGGPIEYRNLDEAEIDARLAALEAKNAENRRLAH